MNENNTRRQILRIVSSVSVLGFVEPAVAQETRTTSSEDVLSERNSDDQTPDLTISNNATKTHSITTTIIDDESENTVWSRTDSLTAVNDPDVKEDAQTKVQHSLDIPERTQSNRHRVEVQATIDGEIKNETATLYDGIFVDEYLSISIGPYKGVQIGKAKI